MPFKFSGILCKNAFITKHRNLHRRVAKHVDCTQTIEIECNVLLYLGHIKMQSVSSPSMTFTSNNVCTSRHLNIILSLYSCFIYQILFCSDNKAIQRGLNQPDDSTVFNQCVLIFSAPPQDPKFLRTEIYDKVGTIT